LDWVSIHADAAIALLHHIASYLGITNVALSRIRSRMGLIPARRPKALA